jgi:uncharacterized membrane protein YeaQ/YmgE (transglycosylase-associated protein family)
VRLQLNRDRPPARLRDGPGRDRLESVSLPTLLVLLVVSGLCGSIGSGLAGHKNAGCLGSIALGFVGALLGMWLARHLHLPELFSVSIGRESFPVVWSIIGAALFVGVLSMLTRPPRPY